MTSEANGKNRAVTEHKPQRIGVILLGYVVVLGILIVHGLGLSIASIVVNANPSIGGLEEPVPWINIAFYVATNVMLAVYTAVVMVLILRRRRSAVVHNAVFALATTVCLVVWHLLGMKSTLGVIVDSLPGLLGAVYLMWSPHVRKTLTQRGR